MTPAELQQLHVTHAPDVPDITAAARRDEENPYGLTVALEGGGRAWWAITGRQPRPGPPPAADHLPPAWLRCQHRTLPDIQFPSLRSSRP